MIKIGYFPGCSLEGSSKEYNESLLAVSKACDIQLEEIHDWNCCGATAAHSLSKVLAISLPARVLALAEKQGYEDILVPCAACYSRLLSAYNELNEDAELLEKVKNIVEIDFSAKVKPFNVIDYIQKYIQPKLKEKIKKPLNAKIACYYGCLLVRPPKLVDVERYEDPLLMENIVKELGANPLDWAFKTECCGAGLSVSRTDIVGKLSGKIVDDAVSRGANMLMVACPMCQSNLDMRRSNINSYLNKQIDVPVLFITQVIGLALGLSEKSLGLQRHFVPFKLELFDKPIPKETLGKTRQVEEV